MLKTWFLKGGVFSSHCASHDERDRHPAAHNLVDARDVRDNHCGFYAMNICSAGRQLKCLPEQTWSSLCHSLTSTLSSARERSQASALAVRKEARRAGGLSYPYQPQAYDRAESRAFCLRVCRPCLVRRSVHVFSHARLCTLEAVFFRP